jgi:hypothetical protein
MNRSWLIRVLAWDGCLPLAISLSPWAIGAVFGPDVAVLCAVFVPMGAACFRASIGWKQLVEVCQGPPGILRQLLFAAAIIWLMFFEGLASVLHCEPPVKPRPGEREFAWLVAAGIYAIYLMLMALALVPLRASTAEVEAPGQIDA